MSACSALHHGEGKGANELQTKNHTRKLTRRLATRPQSEQPVKSTKVRTVQQGISFGGIEIFPENFKLNKVPNLDILPDGSEGA